MTIDGHCVFPVACRAVIDIDETDGHSVSSCISSSSLSFLLLPTLSLSSSLSSFSSPSSSSSSSSLSYHHNHHPHHHHHRHHHHRHRHRRRRRRCYFRVSSHSLAPTAASNALYRFQVISVFSASLLFIFR